MSYNFPKRLSLIQSTSASTSASISFTSGISSNFSVYYVKIRQLHPDTDGTDLLLTFSTNGGSNYLSSNYKWAIQSANSAATDTSNRNDAGSSITVDQGCSNNAAWLSGADIVFYNLNDGTFCPRMFSHAISVDSIPRGKVMVCAGLNTGTIAVNAIKFAMSSGNITSGTFSFYGVTEGGLIY